MNNLRIFLSSTKLDLQETRTSVLKFLSVLKGTVVSMEVFGSDESKPKEFCLEQVRQCNLFIGIYAERYGSVDPDTGLSMSELEYREAHNLLGDQKLLALLVYIIDPKTAWPIDQIDRDPQHVEKLRTLKASLKNNHTVSFFSSTEELPFQILQDVIRKIGVGITRLFRPKEHSRPARRTSIDRPIGMEFYTEDLSPLFHGRALESKELFDQIIEHRMSLLIGGSGIGKTSLLYAGLFPKLRELGWRTALIRPLAAPMENLRRSLWDQLLEGPIADEFDFTAVVHSIGAEATTSTLVVIDQFEDILGTKASTDIEPLTRALLDVYKLSAANLRLLITYRGDVESQIGPIWQKVSGSAGGLPRLYLGPLGQHECERALLSNLQALNLSLGKNQPGQASSLKTTIVQDLITESLMNGYAGVYPPFIQMVISRISADAVRREYAPTSYQSAGLARGIISDFLIKQLKYLGQNERTAREILIALVSSYGVKTQKTLPEIAHETSRSERQVNRLLRLLIDLRLVREIDGSFEIVHDFLAKTILLNLASTDEIEAKKFKDLLSSRAVAYASTGAVLTRTEHFHIYKYRSKLLCAEEDVKLLLYSYLAENLPVFYWLRSYPKETVRAWIRPLRSVEGERGDDHQRNVYRLLVDLGEKVKLDAIAKLFSGFRWRSELKEMFDKVATRADLPSLIKLSGSGVPDIASASESALTGLLSLSDEDVLASLARGRQQRLCFENISLTLARSLNADQMRKMLTEREKWKKLLAIYGLGESGSFEDLTLLEGLLSKRMSAVQKTAIVKSMIRLASKLKLKKIVQVLWKSEDPLVKSAWMESHDEVKPLVSLRTVLKSKNYLDYQMAWMVRGLAQPKDLQLLKKWLNKPYVFSTALGELVIAICEHGGEEEFDFLLQFFLNTKKDLAFEEASHVLNSIASIASRKHLATIRKIVDLDDFWLRWEYSEAEDAQSPIPVANPSNAYFIRWLIAVTYAKLATRNQLGKLRLLLHHPYWTVRNAAADALLRIGKVSDLDVLIEDAITFKGAQDATLKALCGLDRRFYPFEEESSSEHSGLRS